MEFIELRRQDFDKFSKNHPLNSIFQTSSWASVKGNWTPYFLGVKNIDIEAAALVLIREIKFKLKFAYLPRGPIIGFNKKDTCTFFFKNLKKFLKSKGVILCKCDPNIIIDEIDFLRKDEVAYLKNELLINQLKSYGLYHTGYTLNLNESIQPRIQLEVDLSRVDIPNKTMKKIRGAINKNVEIINEKNRVASLVKMVEFTKERHKISLRNEAYFKTILDSFKDEALVLSAYHENILISSCLLVKSNNAMEILYSGYDDAYKNLNSTYLLRYEAISIAKSMGCKYFNFGGVQGTLDDGLTVFKSSFNPSIKIYIGEFNLYTYGLFSRLAGLVFNKLKGKINL